MKYQRIGALIKANYKQLKAILALEVKKLGPSFLTANLGKFSLFDGFLDLANFWPFDNFLVFNSINFSINLLLISIIPTLLVANTLLAANIYNDTVIFNINISDVAILLKP